MKFKWDFSELVNFGNRLGDTEAFARYQEDICKEIADILRKMLLAHTPVKTGKLKAGWGGDNAAYKVKRKGSVFEVTLENKVEYARWVNDGHRSFNQFGGPYFVQNRTPKIAPEYNTIDDDTYVFGHFFVEISVYKVENSKELEKILYQQLENWFRWCLNGK